MESSEETLIILDGPPFVNSSLDFLSCREKNKKVCANIFVVFVVVIQLILFKELKLNLLNCDLNGYLDKHRYYVCNMS